MPNNTDDRDEDEALAEDRAAAEKLIFDLAVQLKTARDNYMSLGAGTFGAKVQAAGFVAYDKANAKAKSRRLLSIRLGSLHICLEMRRA